MEITTRCDIEKKNCLSTAAYSTEGQVSRDGCQVAWNRRPGAMLRKLMLVLNTFKGHLTTECQTVICAMNTDLAVTHGGIISQL
jgi:hypothetical protein